MTKPKFYKALLEEYADNFPDRLFEENVHKKDFSRKMIQLVDDISEADGIKGLMNRTEIEERLEKILTSEKEKNVQYSFTDKDLQIRVLLYKIFENYKRNVEAKEELRLVDEKIKEMKEKTLQLRAKYRRNYSYW